MQPNQVVPNCLKKGMTFHFRSNFFRSNRLILSIFKIHNKNMGRDSRFLNDFLNVWLHKCHICSFLSVETFIINHESRRNYYHLTSLHQVLKRLKNVKFPFHQRKKKKPDMDTFIKNPQWFAFISALFSFFPLQILLTNFSTKNCLVRWWPFKFAALESAQSLLSSPFLPISLLFCASSAVLLKRAVAAAPW